jgi:hypothetical protein
LRLSSAVARLMERVRLGLLALDRMGAAPDGGPGKFTGYYWIGEKDLFRDRTPTPANDVGGSQKTETRSQTVPTESPGLAGATAASGQNSFCLPSSDFCLLRRGRLKNGNPSGDYLAAPRCGACTRAGHACRQPAMKNGRCRFHGGKSTGPRTAAGLERARTARLVHGFRSAEIIDLRKAAAATSRRLRALLSGAIPAGHEVDRHVLRVVAGSGRESSSRPRVAGEGWGGGAPAMAEIVPITAGHGLHRHDSGFHRSGSSTTGNQCSEGDRAVG